MNFTLKTYYLKQTGKWKSVNRLERMVRSHPHRDELLSLMFQQRKADTHTN